MWSKKNFIGDKKFVEPKFLHKRNGFNKTLSQKEFQVQKNVRLKNVYVWIMLGQKIVYVWIRLGPKNVFKKIGIQTKY